MRRLCAFVFAWLWIAGSEAVPARQAETSGDRVVLVTIDGVRTEEMFGGLDVEVLRSTLKGDQRVEESPAYQRYWASTREERRRRLMPFLWELVTTRGSIAGDPQAGSAVRLRNRHWFSYPGYAEILLGVPDDERIRSNDPIRNPHVTVLETIRERLNLKPDAVATFASWGVFDAIAEHTEGATFVNAGLDPLASTDDRVRLLNRLQADASTPWDGTRFDAFTFQLAMRHLAGARPRVLYLAFDETDDWAHDGRYTRVLDALARTDGYLRELWEWIQQQPDYAGRTHLLVTTDHGRGHTIADWDNHGADVRGANEVWMAFVSPRMNQRGVWRNHEPLSTSQVAGTIAAWMGVDWSALHPDAGRAIR